MDAASQYPVTVIPGMELCTIEEVHVLCLFKQLDAAMAFDDYVYKHLIKIKNRPDIFGFQQIYNSEDAIAGEEPYLLINATDISFDNVWQLTADYGGIMIPAHVDKDSTSLLSNLGLIPQDSRFRCAEIKNRMLFWHCKKSIPIWNNVILFLIQTLTVWNKFMKQPSLFTAKAGQPQIFWRHCRINTLFNSKHTVANTYMGLDIFRGRRIAFDFFTQSCHKNPQ